MRQAKPERVALLTTEQLAVYQHWLEEDASFQKLFDEWLVAVEAKDQARIDAAREGVYGSVAPACDHGHPNYSTCNACMEIEYILYPELYGEDGERKTGEEIGNAS